MPNQDSPQPTENKTNFTTENGKIALPKGYSLIENRENSIIEIKGGGETIWVTPRTKIYNGLSTFTRDEISEDKANCYSIFIEPQSAEDQQSKSEVVSFEKKRDAIEFATYVAYVSANRNSAPTINTFTPNTNGEGWKPHPIIRNETPLEVARNLLDDDFEIIEIELNR